MNQSLSTLKFFITILLFTLFSGAMAQEDMYNLSIRTTEGERFAFELNQSQVVKYDKNDAVKDAKTELKTNFSVVVLSSSKGKTKLKFTYDRIRLLSKSNTENSTQVSYYDSQNPDSSFGMEAALKRATFNEMINKSYTMQIDKNGKATKIDYSEFEGIEGFEESKNLLPFMFYWPGKSVKLNDHWEYQNEGKYNGEKVQLRNHYTFKGVKNAFWVVFISTGTAENPHSGLKGLAKISPLDGLPVAIELFAEQNRTLPNPVDGSATQGSVSVSTTLTRTKG